MNETLQQALVEIISKASKGIDASVSFLSQEIPDVVQQLLLWNAVKSGLMFAIGLAIVYIGVTLWCSKSGISKAEAREAYKNGEAWTRYGGAGSVTSIEYDTIMSFPDYWKSRIPAAIIMLIGALWLTGNLNWLMIIVAPKIWLIEYVSNLVK